MERTQAFFDSFMAWLPNLIAALVILIVAYIIARLVAAAVKRIGRSLHIDRSLDQSMVGDYKRSMAPRLSVVNVLGRVVFWVVFGIGILLALTTLQIPLLGNAIATVVGYLPHVIAALLILTVGVLIAGGVGKFARRFAGDTMLGRLVETAVPLVIVAIAIAMALVQLQISPPIVIATYVIVLGAVGLGLALAFGLGGRLVAQDMLRKSYDKAQERMPELREDARLAKERAEAEAERVKEEAKDRDVPPGEEPGARRAA
jgi:uncharacterized membrane-anchored protein YhcB (DUF1043 family)